VKTAWTIDKKRTAPVCHSCVSLIGERHTFNCDFIDRKTYRCPYKGKAHDIRVMGSGGTTADWTECWHPDAEILFKMETL